LPSQFQFRIRRQRRLQWLGISISGMTVMKRSRAYATISA